MAKKTTKKIAKKQLLTTKAAPKKSKSAKPKVKKLPKKARSPITVKKTSTKKSTPKTTKKNLVKKSQHKKTWHPKKEKLMIACGACLSPRIEERIVGGDTVYRCLRCGYQTQQATYVPQHEVSKHVSTKRHDTVITHLQKREHRITKMNHMFTNFSFRVWMGLVGLLMLITGIILFTGVDDFSWLPFVVVGLVLAFTGERM